MVEFEPSCAAFLEHWKSVRQSTPVPSVEDFLDRPSVPHAPFVFMAEITDAGILMRLHGTGLAARWNEDFTNRSMYFDAPDYEKQLIDYYQTVINHPCGGYLLNEYNTVTGGFARMRVIYLPLTSKPGRRPRIVGYVNEIHPVVTGAESLTVKREIMESHWIDIGAGVPAHKPKLAGG